MAQGAQARDVPQATLSWHACDGHFRCARLPVPLNYAQPNGTQIHLAVIELPSTSAHPVADLVMNPGGPGGSGVQFLEQTSFPKALRAKFNLVSFDPRGVGESDPVRCVNAAGLRKLIAMNPAPTTKAQVSQVVAATKAFVAACKANTSRALLQHVSTSATANDLDRLRAALGERKLTYLGFSYGTFLGELYASRFPTHVRAMVLDGVVDPALSTTTSDLQQAQGFETDLADFFAWCPTNATCHRELPQGARTAYDALFGRLVRGQDIVALLRPRFGGTQEVTIGVAEVALAGALYSKQTWPDLARALAQGLQGNGGLLAALAYSYEGLQPNGSFSNEVAANVAISCVDRPSPTKLSTYERLSDQMAKAAPDFGAAEAWGSLTCAYWPVAPQGKVGPLHAKGAPTILLVGSTGDPATPYRWAQAVAHQLDHSVLLTRRGPGHTGFFFSTCIQRYVERYLTNLSLPPAHTTCATNH